MQSTYFASFLLGEQSGDRPPEITEALEEVAHWIFENPHRSLTRPANWPDGAIEPIDFPDGERVQFLKLEENGGLQAAAVRFEHPDLQGRFWRTDCIITKLDPVEPGVRFTVNVAAGSRGHGLVPVSPPSTRPRIVRTMMDKFGARERFPLKANFFRIQADEAERFVGFLLDAERTIPIVFISRRNRDGQLLCDPLDLADKLVGIAYVCVADDVGLGWSLTNYLDNRLNTYDGAIRLYWPRMTLDDPPYRHRWWTQQQIAALDERNRPLADILLRLISSASVTRHIGGLVRWEDVEREITKHTVQKLRATGTASPTISDDWLRQYETDLAALDGARRELADASERLLEMDGQVRVWKQMYLQLLRQTSETATEKVDDPIEDTESAIEAAIRDFRDQLVVIDGRVERDAQLFEEPELLYAAFKWLATTYWKAKANVARCPDLDKSCRESCQFRYSAHQSEITMGMFATDYEVAYYGSKVKLKEHIGYGTSTEPRHTIRIAFFFDEARQRVVIGYIGQHQSTRRSN